MKIKDLITIHKGKKPELTFENHPNSKRLIQIDDLRPNAIQKFCLITKNAVEANITDVIIAWDGANACISNFGLSGIIGSTLAILRPKSKNIYTPYLGHFLKANKDHLRKKCKGATIPHIDGKVLENLDIPLPPLQEQRRIADILDRADALRAKRREAIEHINALTQSVFLEMFGDPVINSRKWATKSLIEACNLYSGGTPSKSNKGYWNGSLPWFSPKDLKKDDLFDSIDHIDKNIPDTTNLRLLPADTVVIVVRGMILTHSFPVCVLRVSATINQDMKALLPRTSMNAQFLASCLRAQRIHALNQVSDAAHGTKRIDIEGLRKIKVIEPPITLQEQFVKAVQKIQKIKYKADQSLILSNEFFSSLQHRAFTGQLSQNTKHSLDILEYQKAKDHEQLCLS